MKTPNCDDTGKQSPTGYLSVDELLIGTKYEGANKNAQYGFLPAYKAWHRAENDCLKNAVFASLLPAAVKALADCVEALEAEDIRYDLRVEGRTILTLISEATKAVEGKR